MLLKVKVHPASRHSSLTNKGGGSFEIWVREPAENGRANKAALSALAASLKQDVKRLRIVKGAASPNKIVNVFEPGLGR